MDFWTQFFELQDQIAKSKRCNVEDGGCSLNELLSKYSVETDYGFDSSIDCLLDYSHIILSDLRAFESVRVESSFKKEDKVRYGKNTRIVGHDVFNSFGMMTSVENVFSRSFDLSINVLRNLDGLTSHNGGQLYAFNNQIPDLTIITGIHAVRWRITTEFYKLFRGILEKNFGDPLIPVPESIPFEILQKPMSGCEVGCDYKYATLSFRLLFEDMELDCQLHSARVSFDIYIDGQSELDLICESSRLMDTRIEESLSHYSPTMRKRRKKPVCFFVKNQMYGFSIIILITDIESIKFFIVTGEQTICFKVTLRYKLCITFCCIYFLTKFMHRFIRWWIFFSSSVTLGWCSMQSEEATMIQCSNKFSVTVGLSVDKRENSTTVERRGLPILSHSRHQINVEINGMIGRLSYKDAHAINAILKGYVNNIKHNFGRTLIPVTVSKSQQKNSHNLLTFFLDIDISKLNIRSEHIDLWLLDDFQGSTIPLFRISVSSTYANCNCLKFIWIF
uniref:BPI2 domain-containing protein n=1 Tax=Heterorhabditis bacteriophora TaxID=37862 RepID=A0A1I7WZT8_HETBA